MDLYKHLLSYLILLLLGFFSGQTCAGTIKPRPKKALAMAKASNRCPTSILVGKVIHLTQLTIEHPFPSLINLLSTQAKKEPYP